ncbi:branched-chain amino acid ABC transporter permease [Rubeoparvulum massiliense]|uniref:branched-chain amino acid ABC transporter permease n=1 Tax=Rubeoparvulum massiliense TaxID=1631346 RepID=UPI00069F4A4D|nr:branched-chain amino acid ABC transporter permease [Rubeoparvulum massiliense]
MKPLYNLQRLSSPVLMVFTILAIVFLILPMLFQDSRSSLIILTNVAIMAVFAMSYDLLLGYTGIVSFGHVMFFGMGAYTTSILFKQVAPTYSSLALAVVITLVLTGLLSLLLGVFSLRLRTHFFAMLTLAVAEMVAVFAEKWGKITGGSDGFNYKKPELFQDRLLFTYLAIIFMLLIYLLLRRFTLSPLGRVLQGIRENEQRMESLGYNVFYYKVIINVVAGMVAGLAGVMYALSTFHVDVPGVLGVEITLNQALLVTIVGGVGTLIGPIIGTGIIEVLQNYLESTNFDRWLLFFGLAFIIMVIFFPKGIVGTITQRWVDWKAKRFTASMVPPGSGSERAEDIKES